MFHTSYFKDSYKDFKSALESYDKNFNENLFIKAIEVAETSHKDQFRASGDPYIVHPFEVCKSLIDLKLDTETVITGLLHDVIEDTTYSSDQLTKEFGSSISNLVSSNKNFLTLLNSLIGLDNRSSYLNNKKFFLKFFHEL